MQPSRPKSIDELSARDSLDSCLVDEGLREDLEAFLRRDMRARVINRLLRVIRIIVESTGLFLSIPAALVEVIAVCYLWNQQRTINWVIRHKDIVSKTSGWVGLFAYFWMMSFTFATLPVLRKRLPPGGRNDLLAVFFLFLIVLPICVGIEIFHHLARLALEDGP